MNKAFLVKAGKLVLGNILVFAVLLLLLEFSIFLLYAYLPKSEAALMAAREYYRAHNADVIQYNPDCAQFDPDLAYTLRPGSSVFKNREFHTQVHVNSMGLRDDEASLDAPEVIFLGDSHGMGWGVEGEETYPQLVEAALGIKGLNAGISSYGTARASILLSRLDRSNLKALVVQYAANDGYENKRFVKGGYRFDTMNEETYREMGRQALKRVEPYEWFNYIKYFVPRYHEARKNLKAWNNRTEEEKEKERGSALKYNGVEARNFLKILANGPVDVSGVPIFVFELNPNNGLDTLWYDEAVWQMEHAPEDSPLRKLNITAIDLVPVLTDDDFFVLDHHMRASGHEKIAEVLVKEMQKLEAFKL